ncbi:YigZ family protein [Rhodoferax sp. GW822-FHT02A01]|uniref:IMPACT family protein n=1 Tax=Rhodoferax sp. GW822-FHT02A01 TaxID=3141537 RepID=UPI00315D2C45
MPQSLSSTVESELLIKKSRFIGCVQPVPDRAAAQAIVASLKAQHPGAAHVCWALMAGGHSAAVDDGEPSGTAGKPMLEVLRHQDLEGVLATVVRYYGGIQLGAGGLVRAYTDCVAQALKNAVRVPIVKSKTLHCAVPYALEGMLRREIEAAGGALLDVQHSGDVEFAFSLAETSADALVAHLNEAGQGRIAWRDANAS